MSDVKRYVTTCDCMSEAGWGDYVRHDDYARLEQECKDAKCQAELMQRAAEVFREDRDAALKQVEGLREALEKIAAIEDRYNCGDWDEIEEAREIANAALSAKP